MAVSSGAPCSGLWCWHALRSRRWQQWWSQQGWFDIARQAQSVHESYDVAPVVEPSSIHQAAIQDTSVHQPTRQFAAWRGDASLRK
jgi:hypothetical protein